VENLIAEVQREVQKEVQNKIQNAAQNEAQKSRRVSDRVTPRAAAFALLGMINWIYQWYKPEGELQAQNLVPQFTDLFFGGIFL
jgi:hypothetical protein